MLVDTGAEHSVLLSPLGKTSSKTSLIQGVTRSSRYPWTTARTVNLGTLQVSHSFLVIPESQAPLIGRDLLHKIGAHIHFSRGTVSLTDDSGPLTVLTLALQDEHLLYSDPAPLDIPPHVRPWVESIPKVWVELSGVGLAINQPPIIPLKSGATPIWVKQYPMSAEARNGIQPHVKRLLASRILTPCKSPWNTPLLPVRKPDTGDYRPVQDLREVNKCVEDVHSTIPNPYTLLSNLHPSLTWYTTLDLKDAFFSLPLAAVSQPIFAFEWFSPETHSIIQLTWTRLSQRLKLSPTIFSNALAEDLKPFRQLHPTVTLLQYVDDLLITSPTEESCKEATRDLLLCLEAAGYCVSAKKAHIARREVTSLGYRLHDGLRWLTPAMTQAILSFPTPSSPRQVQKFLGSVGYCRLWVPNFAETAKPLYAATRETSNWVWTEDMEIAFQDLRKAMLQAPALALPDPENPYQLFVEERQGVAKGVLTQKLGPWDRPVACLSKQLDPVSAGWPSCLRIITAVALLVKDADKLTHGQPLLIATSHAIESVLRQPPVRWLSHARLTHYQSLLLNEAQLSFRVVSTLNPATLLPTRDDNTETHSCQEILVESISARPDLKDVPLANPDLVFFTDGSRFMPPQSRRAGAAVVDHTGQVIWDASLPEGTSAQKAELVALTAALRAAKDKQSLYTQRQSLCLHNPACACTDIPGKGVFQLGSRWPTSRTSKISSQLSGSPMQLPLSTLLDTKVARPSPQWETAGQTRRLRQQQHGIGPIP
ncbi:LOW QUALITY PROTEIN: uncharacterized protein LOC103096476 [Monodelphis domestica]|uniref:LOW QUALITY PROTEIN: uncharacterized protein LOC103096476 n=1 Tax=Monodelphis domestica TaxID=13616 RepID=UPI0024E1BBD3|nr:LOW QUALITY PROTEIN: uncharacterized protein LOC103096476 [Monodelphis domestica]